MDLLSIFEKYSMDSFLLANTGADEQLQIIENSELIEGLYKGQELALERVFHPHLWSDFIFKIVGKMQKLRKYVAITSEFLTKVMNARKVVKKNVQEYAGLKSKPIMDLMLDIHEFKDSYIINEMRTFFYAAVETSGSSLAFTCILLGMNQDVQTRCYEEVIDVVGINKQIEFSDLPKLKYLDMILSESLRILPIVPYIGRHSSAPLDLSKYQETILDGVTIPEDIDILIPIFRLHRNPKYYPDPLKFNPERFSPEQIAKRPQYAYIPFSGGPRNCIGWKYATMMMKTTLANIVRNFEIQSSYKNVEDIRLEAQILIRAVDTMDYLVSSDIYLLTVGSDFLMGHNVFNNAAI
ncbi:cytochrome P450 4C1-like [Aethina tumida]|uniref:cytochrome P450 4C1-like n=1 Tax=Aethina tumida TaxID=116153 RepID=UPI002148B24B|nr:cytochrome P450 4C1-like [Aethina tumida]